MADDIAQWLQGLGLGNHVRAFAKNGINFEIPTRLSDGELKDLGFNLGDRHRLKVAIEARDDRSSAQTAPAEQIHEPAPPKAERRHPPRQPVARRGQGERGPRRPRPYLRLICRGLRHERSEGGEGTAGRAVLAGKVVALLPILGLEFGKRRCFGPPRSISAEP